MTHVPLCGCHFWVPIDGTLAGCQEEWLGTEAEPPESSPSKSAEPEFRGAQVAAVGAPCESKEHVPKTW